MTSRTRSPQKPRPKEGVQQYDAIAFLGRMQKVEIWQIVNYLFEHDSWAKMVSAYDPVTREWVGLVDIRKRRATIDIFSCKRDFDRVTEKTDADPTVVWQVSGSSLDERYRGKGIGVAMYLGAALVARRDGAAIAADACFMSGTSEDARRVWESEEFNKHVVRSGLVAYMKEPR